MLVLISSGTKIRFVLCVFFFQQGRLSVVFFLFIKTSQVLHSDGGRTSWGMVLFQDGCEDVFQQTDVSYWHFYKKNVMKRNKTWFLNGWIICNLITQKNFTLRAIIMSNKHSVLNRKRIETKPLVNLRSSPYYE